MNPILLDFEKLFATIKNPNNGFVHLRVIENMINVFERKYKDENYLQTHLLVKYIRFKFSLLKEQLNGGTQD